MQVPTDSKPRWTRRKEARPQEVLAAALDLFVEKGYAATRLEDVARRAGVSKGTLYLYFANKEELFKAMVRETVVPALGEAEQNIAGFNGSSADLLRDVLLAWWDKYGSTELAGVSKLMMSEAGNFPELANFYNAEVVTRGNAVIGHILARGITRGEFRPVDIETMTLVLIAPILSLIMWTHSIMPCATQLDPRVFLLTSIDLALRGLQPDSPAPSAIAPAAPC
jgi:AcrR family transcriptional regulator